jgi:hypothetical protein
VIAFLLKLAVVFAAVAYCVGLVKQTVCKLNFLPSSSLIFVKTGYWAAIDEPRANEPQVNEPQTRGVVENVYRDLIMFSKWGKVRRTSVEL